MSRLISRVRQHVPHCQHSVFAIIQHLRCPVYPMLADNSSCHMPTGPYLGVLSQQARPGRPVPDCHLQQPQQLTQNCGQNMPANASTGLKRNSTRPDPGYAPRPVDYSKTASSRISRKIVPSYPTINSSPSLSILNEAGFSGQLPICLIFSS